MTLNAEELHLLAECWRNAGGMRRAKIRVLDAKPEGEG